MWRDAVVKNIARAPPNAQTRDDVVASARVCEAREGAWRFSSVPECGAHPLSWCLAVGKFVKNSLPPQCVLRLNK